AGSRISTPGSSASARSLESCELEANWSEDKRWEPVMGAEERERSLRLWKKAVTRTFDWVDEDTKA
ncbi:hypothetical protein, partial [Glutamicibacter protophormiae]|uniref:hypothetical protein n=1 Tax=Glutamicibacter protophormiae TaxID=37930 RepID=UPI0033223CE4